MMMNIDNNDEVVTNDDDNNSGRSQIPHGNNILISIMMVVVLIIILLQWLMIVLLASISWCKLARTPEVKYNKHDKVNNRTHKLQPSSRPIRSIRTYPRQCDCIEIPGLPPSLDCHLPPAELLAVGSKFPLLNAESTHGHAWEKEK